jgi:hypothetical protein
VPHSAVVELSVEVQPSAAFPVDFTVACVGRDLTGLNERLGNPAEGERRFLLDPAGHLDDLTAGTGGWPSVYAALSALLAQPIPPEDRVGHVLVFVTTLAEEQAEPLLEVASRLAEIGWGVDLIALHPAAELGLLSQVATVARGELLVADRGFSEVLRTRMVALRAQPLAAPLLDIEISRGIRSGRFYRLEPVPVLLGIPQLTETDRRVVIDVGPLGAGARISWLFDLEVPARTAGSYLLAEATLSYRQLDGRRQRHAQAIQHVMVGENAGLVIDVARIVNRDRAEAVAELESIGVAFHRGDGRRVAVGLSSLVRRLLAMGDEETVERAFGLRLSFLRSGSIDRLEFNRLRMALRQSPGVRPTA